MTYIWVGNLTMIRSYNGLWPDEVIIYTSCGMLSIRPLGMNISSNFIQNSYIYVQDKCISSQTTVVRTSYDLQRLNNITWYEYD